MCGIAGWLDFGASAPNMPLIRAMTDTLYHRGPDGEGFHVDGPIHLGHRRLSIIDVEGGDQPIANEDESIWIVFNGEIFNFQELKSDLDSDHQFKTNSDTETIVHAYEQYGLDFVNHLRGQFAIALWDSRKRQLVLARDRMGQKPLYYCETKQGIIFGSELKSLVRHPEVKRDINLLALDAFMAHGYIPEPMSIFQGVKKLLPAHVATIDQTGMQLQRYWQPEFSNDLHLSENEALDQLDQLLEESVRLRMISDVPLGAFLSGGIDSSLVVAYMSRVSDQPIKTFNIGFEEQSHDERPYADLVASQFETDHHRFVVKPEAATVLPELVKAFDEPFADSSALAVYYLSKMTRQHVTVALNGDGGDESFAGYRRYGSAARFARFSQLPFWLRKSAGFGLGLANRLTAGKISALRRFNRWSDRLQQSMGEVYQAGVTIHEDIRDSIFSESVREQLRLENRSSRMMNAIDASNIDPVINRIMQVEQETYLPGDLLVKVDRMTMWHSLEGRSPFLDHKIVEFAAQLNCDTKFPGNQLKYLLKKLSLRFFPERFVYRQKMGFGVPLEKWFRGELKTQVEEIIHDGKVVNSGLLNRDGIKAIFAKHLSGTHDYKRMLWSIMNLELWFQSLPDPIATSTEFA